MNQHNTEIRHSFDKQAAKFESYHMSKAEYTDYLIRSIHPFGSEVVLEVAAGTCICGRALAPYVKSVECLDLTEAMLVRGMQLANDARINNMSFTIGDAEALPYEDAAFDLVITRLSLHHFTNPEIPFSEMRRVLKKGGKLVIWDMEADEGEIRNQHDLIERMRDPSHTRMLTCTEFKKLYADDFILNTVETTLIPVSLQSWMDLTETPIEIQDQIRQMMKEDMAGGTKTGFEPYMEGPDIYFNHRWLLLIGSKKV